MMANTAILRVHVRNDYLISLLRSFRSGRIIGTPVLFTCCCEGGQHSGFPLCENFGKRLERLDMLLEGLEHLNCTRSEVHNALPSPAFQLNTGFPLGSGHLRYLYASLSGTQLT